MQCSAKFKKKVKLKMYMKNMFISKIKTFILKQYIVSYFSEVY